MSSRRTEEIKIPRLKPRNKHLHDTLLSKGGGRMKDRKDKTRQKEKELRQLTRED